MITFTNQKMFEIMADSYVNPVNCVGVCGAGLALVFKQKFPRMFEDYKEMCDNKALKPGVLHIWMEPPIIINFPTKIHWKNESKYEYIDLGLRALRKYLETSAKSIVIPGLGCGLGGLDFAIVSEMIKIELRDLSNDIYVVKPLKQLELNI